MWYFKLLPPLTYWHPWNATTNCIEQVVALYCTVLLMWWHKDELWLDGLKITHLYTQTACLQHKNQTEGSSFYLYIDITIHNIYCCNFHLLLSHYFNAAVLLVIYKVSVTKRQSAASVGIFVFKLPYICNSINQRYSSRLSICRDRVTSLKKELGSQIQQKHIPFKIKTAHIPSHWNTVIVTACALTVPHWCCNYQLH